MYICKSRETSMTLRTISDERRRKQTDTFNDEYHENNTIK